MGERPRFNEVFIALEFEAIQDTETYNSIVLKKPNGAFTFAERKSI